MFARSLTQARFVINLFQKDKLVLPAVSLTSSYVVLCHYCKLLEPDTSAEASGGGGATPSKPGGRSVTPKPMTSHDLASAKGSTWSDWAVWTLFNLSITGDIFNAENVDNFDFFAIIHPFFT